MDNEQSNMAPYLALIETCFPEIHIQACRLHLNGWDSIVLEINASLIFRFPRPGRPDVQAQLAKEIALLPALARTLPLSIPRFEYIGDGADDAGGRFVGYRKIPGVELRHDDLTAAQPRLIAQQLAAFLTCLHRFPVQQAAQLGLPDISPADWLQHYQKLYAQMREQVFPLLEPSMQRRTVMLWEDFLTSEAAVAFRPTLIHRDLNSDHILYDAPTGAITGIIDWGDVCIGDPAMDFTDLMQSYGRQFAEAVLVGYQQAWDDTFWQRMRFYAAIMPLQEVLYGLLEGEESHLQRGLERAKRAGG